MFSAPRHEETNVKGRFWLVLGAALAAAAVALGAFHAHGLQGWLERAGTAPDQLARRLADAEIAIRYQMYHALGLLLLGAVLLQQRSALLHLACLLLSGGLLLFAGGLYLIVFAGTALHWAIVPAGGLVLISGWCVAALALLLLPRTGTASS
jgi:uncharacterized membrane protein YgdD (TMEM256/DUF423 family)